MGNLGEHKPADHSFNSLILIGRVGYGASLEGLV